MPKMRTTSGGEVDIPAHRVPALINVGFRLVDAPAPKASPSDSQPVNRVEKRRPGRPRKNTQS
jgi:hypothetical protein